MAQISQESKFVEANNADAKVNLPWWTWVVPFFVSYLGTWLSLWFKTDPGVSLWYLPTAFGIVMAYWWGPRALLGVYLNAVVNVPLWGLPWQRSFLYALPGTLEVGLSWLLFMRVAKGKPWMPDLGNVGKFLFWGSLAPTLIADLYLVWQLHFWGNITQTSIWENWQILFSSDLATQFVFAVPALIIFTRQMNEKGWTWIRGNIPRQAFLPEHRSSPLDVIMVITVLVLVLILIVLFPIRDLWIFYGFLMVFLAVRYGLFIAMVGISWVGVLTFLLPAILTGKLGNSTASYSDLLTVNLGILLLSGVALLTGRAISDLSTEINERKQSEENLRKTEAQYRTLAEQIPPIVYMSGLNQHVGVTYISPRVNSLGFTSEEWVADPELWLRRIHPDDRSRIEAELQKSEHDGTPFRSEYRLVARDGSVRWFLDEAIDVLDDDGKALFRQGFMLDITSRKQADKSLLSRERYLAQLNEMTRTILLSNDYDAILQTLALDMKKIIDADDSYILRWEEEFQRSIPVITTANLDFQFTQAVINENATSITASILQAGHVLVVHDVFKSPYIGVETAKQYPAHSIIGVPLIVGDDKLGVVIIAFNTPHQFTQEEIERVEQAGNQIALVLRDFQQNMEIEHRLKEGDALTQIGRALSETERVGTDKVLQLIVDSARELIREAEESVIHLIDAGEQALVPRAISGFEAGTKMFGRPKMHMGEGVAGRVIRTGETINIGDIYNSPLFIIKGTQPTFKSLMVAPVQSGEQQIGTISVQSGELNAFSSSDAELLKSLGIQAAIALENTRLFETTQQRLREVDALYKISQGLAASLDPDELIEDIVTLLKQNFGYYHVQIFLLDSSSGDMVLQEASGEIGHQLLEQDFRLPSGSGIVGHVMETANPFVTNNVNEVVFFGRNPLLPDTQSELTVPIRVNGEVAGVLDIQDKPPHRLTDSDLQLMSAVADQLAVALQKAELYTNLQISLHQEQTVRSQLIQSERLALVGRLLASVSHELNNPLQAIQNALFLLRDEISLSGQAKQDLDVILSESERMAVLIERLRSAYRPDRIRDIVAVDLNNLIEDVHILIATHMRKKEITFEFMPDSSLPGVSGLSDQIRQVVLNLFLNAIEVMEPGGCLTVSTQSLPAQHEVLFTVKDTGPGIDPEILPKIFDAFITNKRTGTGLGLTITHDIIEQHNGRIEAENDPQGGAIFMIWLPVYEEEYE